MKRIPFSIDPCPIFEAVVELRFEPHVSDSGAVLGLVYNEIKERYSQIQAYDITQLPQIFIKNNIELKYKPTHKLYSKTDSTIFVNVGPNTISIVHSGIYPGWTVYSESIFFVLNKIDNILKQTLRLGIRYINFFDGDQFENTELSILQKNNELNANWKQLVYEIQEVEFTNRINIWNNAIKNNRKGTLIDIDTYLVNPPNSINIIKQFIEKGHKIEKGIFFNILKEEFVKSKLNPQFE